jgi:CheY-like chemotaxis protein
MGDKLDALGGTGGAPRLRVLLVDDNNNTVRLLTYLFNEAGWEVFGYTSPEEALERLKQQEVDLIVSDFRMYPFNGPNRSGPPRPCW